MDSRKLIINSISQHCDHEGRDFMPLNIKTSFNIYFMTA